MRVTASLVGQFFRFRCDRQFRWEGIPASERSGDVARSEWSAAAELLRESGRQWERTRLRKLIWRVGADRVRFAGWDPDGRARKLPRDEVLTALRDPGEMRFLVQPELQLADPDNFARRCGLEPGEATFAAGQPDLLEIRRTPRGIRFRVADIKASPQPGVAHFAQVAFYTLLLEDICRAENIPGRVDTRTARIWSHGGADRFDLRPYRHHLRRFLREDLPRLVRTPPAQAGWHAGPGCMGCGFWSHCRAEAERTDDLARVPGISPLAKTVLHGRGIHTVKDLARAFRRDTYTGCHALESQAAALKQRAQALSYGKVFDVQRETHRLAPARADPLLLAVERDPITGLCFAIGVRGPNGTSRVWMAADSGPNAEREMLCGLLRELGREARGSGLLVWDAAEWDMLTGALKRHGHDPEVQRLLAPLLPLFAPEQGFPVAVLLDAASDLFALPVPFQYDLASVSAVLRPKDRPHLHRSAPDWQQAHQAWAGDAAGRVAAERSVSCKLAGLDSVLRAVRERAARGGRLRGQPPHARGKTAPRPLAHPELEALRVSALMEAAAQEGWIRALHALPAEQRAQRWEAVRGMELCARREDGALVFEFDPECRDVKFRPGDFDLLLTNEGTDGLAQADRDVWRARALAVELVEFDLAADPPRVVLAPGDGFAKAEAGGWINLDRRCVLDRAGSDWNTPRVLATLAALDAGEGEAAAVSALLQGQIPPGLAGCTDAERVWNRLRPRLNADQAKAWHAALQQPISLIWGPPGTGKTHLLAAVLQGLVGAGRRRILVSAATHRAIVNLLMRLEPGLHAFKLAGSGSAADADLAGAHVQVIPDARLPALLADDEPVIMGSTVWSLWKQMRDAGKKRGGGPVQSWFDAVVIDEASQMGVAEALIALSSVQHGAQVILCGDDRQLAPVSRTRSESAYARFARAFPPLMLRESHRLNHALAAYPRRAFYPGLVSAAPHRRIAWSGGGEDELFRELFLQPDDAVVLCTYRGVSAAARNAWEAGMVARIARLARVGLVDPATGRAYDAERFASEGLAIVSPHRAQISAILAELQAWGFSREHLPVVDTVERMQGGERDMIIVSYAVADREYAEREAEFLLNPNRFNVAITRPRAKLIVWVSEEVLDVVPRDGETMRASMALKGFVGFCRDAVRDVELPGPAGQFVHVRCRYRTLDTTERPR